MGRLDESAALDTSPYQVRPNVAWVAVDEKVDRRALRTWSGRLQSRTTRLENKDTASDEVRRVLLSVGAKSRRLECELLVIPGDSRIEVQDIERDRRQADRPQGTLDICHTLAPSLWSTARCDPEDMPRRPCQDKTSRERSAGCDMGRLDSEPERPQPGVHIQHGPLTFLGARIPGGQRSRFSLMSALPPDYDTDPGRSRSFVISWQQDVHSPVAERLVAEGASLVLDVGCGIGRFGDAVQGRLLWLGLDKSPRQLADCRYRPVIRADAAQLPVADATFDAVVMLFMLYHLDQPRRAITEAMRVLRPGGLLAACAASRHDHPELLPEGYAPTTFDAEEAPDIVTSVFGKTQVEVDRWDDTLTVLHDEMELAAYKLSHLLPPTAGVGVELPLTLTKRGCLVWGRKS